MAWLTATLLIAGVLVPQLSLGPEELALWLQVVVSGLIVPIWAIRPGWSLSGRGAARARVGAALNARGRKLGGLDPGRRHKRRQLCALASGELEERRSRPARPCACPR